MNAYPNIEALAAGTISGHFREWPRVQPEAKGILLEVKDLRSEVERLRSYIKLQAALRGGGDGKGGRVPSREMDRCERCGSPERMGIGHHGVCGYCLDNEPGQHIVAEDA